MSEGPDGPLATAAVDWQDYSHSDVFTVRFKHLSRASGPQPYRIGVVIEELPPGKQSAPAHYHLREEEHVLVLEGAATLRLGKSFQTIAAGDYIRFAAGEAREHCLFNHTASVCRYLVIGDKLPDDVVVYPDSGKILVRATGELYDKAQPKDYWDGEGGATGSPPRPGS